MSYLTLVSLLLTVFCSVVVQSQTLPSHLTFVDNITTVHCPAPLRNCTVGYVAQQGQTLTGVHVVILVGTAGASAAQVAAVYQYYVERDATVALYCTTTEYPIVFTDLLCPRFTVSPPQDTSCLSLGALADMILHDTVDVLVVPGGYDALLALREDTALRNQVIVPFVDSSVSVNKKRVIITIEEGMELLVATDVLFASNDELLLAAVPATTPMVTDAMATLCASVWRTAPCTGGIISNCSLRQNSSVLVNVASVASGSHNVLLGAATSAEYLNHLLVATSRAMFNYTADQLPLFSLPLFNVSGLEVNCSSPSSNVIAYPPVTPTATQLFTGLPAHASFRSLWGETVNTAAIGLPPLPQGAYNYTADLTRLRGTNTLHTDCLNAHGVDLCRGEKIAVVVAHGTHDAQLIALLAALDDVGVQTYIYCPDRDIPLGTVYTAPYPAAFPSFAVQCTNFYNETFIELANHIVVPGGAVATHRRLRNDVSVTSALLNRNAFGLFGSALILLPSLYDLSFLTVQSASRIVSSNNCPLTENITSLELENTITVAAVGDVSFNPLLNLIPATMPVLRADLTASGFNVSTNATFSFVQYEEESIKRLRKQLGSYAVLSDMMQASFPSFLSGTVTSFVFDNAVDSTTDRLVGAILLASLGAVVLIVVATKCIRKKGKSRSAYTALGATDDGVEVPY